MCVGVCAVAAYIDDVQRRHGGIAALRRGGGESSLADKAAVVRMKVGDVQRSDVAREWQVASRDLASLPLTLPR